MTAMSKACHANEDFKLHLQEPFQTISYFCRETDIEEALASAGTFYASKAKAATKSKNPQKHELKFQGILYEKKV